MVSRKRIEINKYVRNECLLMFWTGNDTVFMVSSVPLEKGGKWQKWYETKKKCLWRSTIFDHLPPFGFGNYMNVCS